MKKIYLSLCLLVSVVSASFAQPIANAGMETWRHTNAVTIFPIISSTPIEAPHEWFGDDTIILTMGPILKATGTFHANLYQDTFRHSGSYSAKVMSLNQDTLGIVPGLLANAKPEFSLSGMGGSLTDFLSFTGGTPTTLRTRTVSAWVAYKPGLDTTATPTMGGPDTGMMIVQAIAVIGGADSVIGMGFMPIFPSDTFVEVTATVMYYGDTTYTTDFARIIFTSSGGASSILDSSTLYVDDVSMTGTHQTPPPPPVDHTGVGNSTKGNNVVAVYPNPANNSLYFDAKMNGMLRCRIMSADGRVVATKAFTGSTSIDVSQIAAGSYFYFLTDEKNTVVQYGKVNVCH